MVFSLFWMGTTPSNPQYPLLVGTCNMYTVYVSFYHILYVRAHLLVLFAAQGSVWICHVWPRVWIDRLEEICQLALRQASRTVQPILFETFLRDGYLLDIADDNKWG